MKRLLEIIGDLIGVLSLFFMLWVGLWADHVYGHNAATRMMRSWNGDNANHKLEVERRLLELAA